MTSTIIFVGRLYGKHAARLVCQCADALYREEGQATIEVTGEVRPPKDRLHYKRGVGRIDPDNSMLRKVISWALFLLVPCSLIAQATGAAMLYGTGAIYLN